MWLLELQQRQKNPTAPKEEWAYLNFTQRFLKDRAAATRHTIMEAWNKERQRHLKIVTKIIKVLL